jgi:hypothetical protein
VDSLIDWSAVKIRADVSIRDGSRMDAADSEAQPDETSKRYLELYYAYFHHRWPIIHRPSLEEETSGGILLSSMTMIGAWLEGSPVAKRSALDWHERLVRESLSQLVRVQALTKCVKESYQLTSS